MRYPLGTIGVLVKFIVESEKLKAKIKNHERVAALIDMRFAQNATPQDFSKHVKEILGSDGTNQNIKQGGSKEAALDLLAKGVIKRGNRKRKISKNNSVSSG